MLVDDFSWVPTRDTVPLLDVHTFFKEAYCKELMGPMWLVVTAED